MITLTSFLILSFIYIVPTRPVPESMTSSLRYYTSDIHKAAFVLPGTITRFYLFVIITYMLHSSSNTSLH